MHKLVRTATGIIAGPKTMRSHWVSLERSAQSDGLVYRHRPDVVESRQPYKSLLTGASTRPSRSKGRDPGARTAVEPGVHGR
jgi:hypothetical protein